MPVDPKLRHQVRRANLPSDTGRQQQPPRPRSVPGAGTRSARGVQEIYARVLRRTRARSSRGSEVTRCDGNSIDERACDGQLGHTRWRIPTSSESLPNSGSVDRRCVASAARLGMRQTPRCERLSRPPPIASGKRSTKDSNNRNPAANESTASRRRTPQVVRVTIATAPRMFATAASTPCSGGDRVMPVEARAAQPRP